MGEGFRMARKLRSLHVSDNHGEYQSDAAIEQVIRFRKEFKPDIIVHHGDCFDLPWLMRRASEEEKNRSITEDMEKGEAFLRQMRPTHYLLGNHESRLWKQYRQQSSGSAKQAMLAGIMERIRDAAGEATMYEYHIKRTILRLGQWHLMHGWRSGIYALRNMVKDIGESLMVGHNHAADDIEVDMMKRPRGISIPCLCRVDMDYADTHAVTFRQNHGYVWGEQTRAGFDMHLVRLNAPLPNVEVIA